MVEVAAPVPIEKDACSGKRPHMADKPLLVLLFEGVLGDICKKEYFDKEPMIPLFLRPGFLAGMKVRAISFPSVDSFRFLFVHIKLF